MPRPKPNPRYHQPQNANDNPRTQVRTWNCHQPVDETWSRGELKRAAPDYLLGNTFQAHSCAAHKTNCNTGWKPVRHRRNGVPQASHE